MKKSIINLENPRLASVTVPAAAVGMPAVSAESPKLKSSIQKDVRSIS